MYFLIPNMYQFLDDVGIMADALDLIQDTLDLTTAEIQFAVGSLNFVSAFGTLIAGQTSDVLGRKRTVLICCALYIVGTFCMSAAQNFTVLLLGRIITGLGVGVSFVVTPVYITEISPPSARGMLSTCFDISINGGIVLGYVVGYIIASSPFLTSKEPQWRLMLVLGAVLPFFVAGSLTFLPESPRWLFARGRSTEALEVLVRFLGDRALAEATLEDMAEAEQLNRRQRCEDDQQNVNLESEAIQSGLTPPFASNSALLSSEQKMERKAKEDLETDHPIATTSPLVSSALDGGKGMYAGSRSATDLNAGELTASAHSSRGIDVTSGASFSSSTATAAIAGVSISTANETRTMNDTAYDRGGADSGVITWRQLLWLDPLEEQDRYLQGVVATVLGIGFWQQASGSEAVLYYASTFLKKAGLRSQRQRLFGYILIGLCKLLPEAVVMRFVDHVGRRPLIVGSGFAVSATIFLLATVFFVDPSGQNGATPFLVVTLLCVYMLAFSLGMGPVTWLLASEMLPLKARAKGMMACSFLNRLISGTVALSALSTAKAFGYAGFFFFYGSVAVFGAMWYCAYVTETKGRSLEEITAQFRGGWERRSRIDQGSWSTGR